MKDDKKITNLIFIIIILFLVAINIYIYIVNNKTTIVESINNKTVNDYYNDMASNEEVAQSITNNLNTMSERNRMQTYIGTYLTLIENQKYDEAYAKLNTTFKSTYFPTIEKYEEYIKSKYPKEIGVTYENIERQGEYYIVTIKLYDTSDSKYSTMEQRIVIKETGNNIYEISFQVK